MSELEEFDFLLPPDNLNENAGPLPTENECRERHAQLRKRADTLHAKAEPMSDHIEERFEDIARRQSPEAARLSPLHSALYDAGGALQGCENAMHCLALAVTAMAQLDHRAAIGNDAAEDAHKRLAHLVHCAELSLNHADERYAAACAAALQQSLATSTVQ
ncbi:hypothetical protein ACFSHT_28880 [Paraburkholderia silviterrae]|uniref:Uncharacterized protein n=1 Tax=Paraburkholderia silviterrae TaxID=2528715 RepID=A0A4R5M6C9_9BURK|nr:hypothetical protein [Paraburkholderia silviterrae]TDG21157.1 hypothetical protein EYW47_22570 [Paraburkholderia silviterrae]